MMIEIIPNWHPVFVHFTVALLSVSLGLFALSLLVKCDQAVLVAKWNLWIGAGISLLTLAAGIYAYNTVAHDTPSHEAMTEHKNLALITLGLLLPVVVWSVMLHRKGKNFGAGFVVLFLVVGGMLLSTAWHGGELVYRYGLGVMSLPKADEHDHAGHSHGGHHDDDSHDHHDDLEHEHGDHESGEMSMDEMDMESMEEADHHGDDGHDHDHDH